MRDPDLVLRAQRAATALEQAWRSWRNTHGLSADPLPPVSGYVGYSLDEPWGQPRVVFGVCAEEAERLAALLEGHDCVGPVHAAVVANPVPGGRVHVPAQAPADAAWQGPADYPSAKQALPPRAAAAEQAADPGSAAGAAEGAPAGPTPIELEASRAIRAAAAGRDPRAPEGPAAAQDWPREAGELAGEQAAASDASGDADSPPADSPRGESTAIAPEPAEPGTALMSAVNGLEDVPRYGQATPPGHAPSAHVPRHAEPAGADLAGDQQPAAPVEAVQPGPYAYPRRAAADDPLSGQRDWPVAGPSEVVAFRPRPELAAYLDEGPEPDSFQPDPGEHGGTTERSRGNRTVRGSAMSRFGKSRRPSPDREPAASSGQGAAQASRGADGADGADRVSASAVAADAAAWASSELPGQAAATDTAV